MICCFVFISLSCHFTLPEFFNFKFKLLVSPDLSQADGHGLDKLPVQVRLDLLDPHDLAAHGVQEGLGVLQACGYCYFLIHICQELLHFRAP